MHGPPDPLGLADVRRRLPRREQVPRPSRRQVLVVLLVALAVTTVGVRLADPVALRGDPPRVDPSDPPAEVVGDSVERLRYVDYTYSLATARGASRVTKVDNTDRELYSSFGDVRKRYYSETGGWVKLQGEGWRALQSREFSHRGAMPFDPEAVRVAAVTVLDGEDGTLVVAVNDSAAVSAILGQEVEAGRLQFFVDVDSGRLRQVRYRRVVGETGGWWTYTFYGYRSTTVERPPGVPGRTPSDLLEDVLED